MNALRRRISLRAAGLALGGGALLAAGAVAAIPNADGVIKACYTDLAHSAGTASGGDLYLIDGDAADCPDPDDNFIAWNQQGPAGPPGPQGPAGPSGEKGETGPAAQIPETPTGGPDPGRIAQLEAELDRWAQEQKRPKGVVKPDVRRAAVLGRTIGPAQVPVFSTRTEGFQQGALLAPLAELKVPRGEWSVRAELDAHLGAANASDSPDIHCWLTPGYGSEASAYGTAWVYGYFDPDVRLILRTGADFKKSGGNVAVRCFGTEDAQSGPNTGANVAIEGGEIEATALTK